MSQKVSSISQRMSLRKPQEDSLYALSKICDLLPLEKGADIAKCVEIIKANSGFKNFEEFEHSFPSFCFALATGVGKTRLMGACISYLALTEGIKNFFVLAPNLTIYEKLKADFTPNTPKYVFRGISEFATILPVLITGENYERGHGVLKAPSGTEVDVFDPIYINIFNISKINSDVKSAGRGGKAPRIKRLSECIGQSYFEYLSGLDDLVLIMDESHRYRADAGMKAINELNPILGIELTATPQVERGARSIPFKNVAYSYSLAQAMNDGFVKEPAVATRKDFDANNFDADSLERLKLEDGVRLHETAKAELEVYAHQASRKRVKPFMLIVAEDTAHADSLLAIIEDKSFFEGRYKGKAITVHSKQGSAEQDEMVAKLLQVEDPNNSTEIVIHVNKLAEGWDVTNLYTIVPLRAANSRTLVEQSIGRGLRLPYGKRTGVEAVDTLTIVSHDKFQEIVNDARRPDSIIRRGVVLGEDIPAEGMRAVTIEPVFMLQQESMMTRPVGEADATKPPTTKPIDAQKAMVQRETLKVMKEFERLPSSSELLKPAIQEQIAAKVRENVAPKQGYLPDFAPLKDIPSMVKETAQAYCAYAIDIPRIVVVPVGDVSATFKDFDLEPPDFRPPPVEQEILVQSLEDEGRRYLKALSLTDHKKPEDYLVSGLMDYDDINYDDHSQLLYKLSCQMVDHLRSYLKDDEAVKNVLLNYNKQLIDLIHSQMEQHYEENVAGFEGTISKGFKALSECHYSIASHEVPRDFRAPVSNPTEIRRMLFTGFKKCYFPTLKFDSDSERMMVVLLEREDVVRKWLRPPDKVFQLDYRHGENYEPDFVVETEDARYLFEVKRRSDLERPDVIAKRDAAIAWCTYATKATNVPWRYVLVPHDAIGDSASFGGLVSRFGC
jgi:type III restriction enzyme